MLNIVFAPDLMKTHVCGRTPHSDVIFCLFFLDQTCFLCVFFLLKPITISLSQQKYLKAKELILILFLWYFRGIEFFTCLVESHFDYQSLIP